MSESGDQKTGRIAILSILLVCIATLFFLYKIDACKTEPQDSVCKEEFIEFPANQGCATNHKCSEGAIVEIVTSQHSGKAGIMCHCVHNTKADAGR